MRTIWTLLALTVAFASTLIAQQPAPKKSSCWDTAMTQDVMNKCAADDFRAAEDEMNSVFQQVLGKFKSDSLAVEKLCAAQKAWLAYREAHLESWYPDYRNRFYGSVRPMCQGLLLAEITKERTKILRQILTEKEEICDFGPTADLP